MITRWDPFREMESLHREINRLFEGSSGHQNGFGETRYPLMDVSENENELTVRALLPGLTAEDVNITFERNVLTLSGEKKAGDIPENVAVLRNERSSGRFLRTLLLRTPVDVNRIQAKFQDGVLTITLPRQEEAKPRQIQVSLN